MLLLRILASRLKAHTNVQRLFVPMAIGLSIQVSNLANNSRVSRYVDYVPEKKQDFEIRIFQYQNCPFCCKARAYFDIKGLNYSIVEVNSLTKSQLKWNEDYKKVPVILLKEKSTGHYHTIMDSSQIISIMESKLRNPKLGFEDILSKYPMESKTSEKSGKEIKIFPQRYEIIFNDPENESLKLMMNHEKEWRKWIDDTFVHVVSPNIYRSFSEALTTFEWFSKFGRWNQEFSFVERYSMVYVGALIMSIVSKRLIKEHHLSENVRSDLYRLVNDWMEEIENVGEAFNGGRSPNLADISMYGIITAFEGTAAFEDMINNTKIGNWFESMKKQIKIQRIFD
ncbi:MAG: hypothetical protein MHMPM18_001034 [Marteilia pararefringens]